MTTSNNMGLDESPCRSALIVDIRSDISTLVLMEDDTSFDKLHCVQ